MKLRKLSSSIALALATLPAAYADVHVYSGIPLIGTEQVPPVLGSSFGALTAAYDDETNMLLYQFQWVFPSGEEATAAHFHGPAARGQTAGVLINLGPVSGSSGRASGVLTLTEEEEAELLGGLWYINVHTAANPAGEIRGQLLPLAPLDTAAVFAVDDSSLELESVIVPGLGVFDAELEWLSHLSTLTFELGSATVKNLDDPDEDYSSDSSDDSGSGSDDDSADSADDSGGSSAVSADDSGGSSADDSASSVGPY